MTEKYTTTEERVSYGIGLQMGDHVNSNSFDGINHSYVVDGLADALAGKDSQVDVTLLEAAFKEIAQRMEASQAEQSTAVIAEGDEYLTKNALREEVTVTASGLQYEVLAEGEGDKPSPESKVRTHYHGTLLDGTVFDSSVEHGEPIEFPVNGVIPGWTEALQLMNVGSKWKLHIPSNLAYGERGAGGSIGPYSTLVFEVELLDIVA